jgi:hypothetical protein
MLMRVPKIGLARGVSSPAVGVTRFVPRRLAASPRLTGTDSNHFLHMDSETQTSHAGAGAPTFAIGDRHERAVAC